ncbi:SURF1 family cytochrome oxidase biogenesis protein [Aeromicrobium sp.]|uniref:SURF1 family cytochrome oxidase biogenesis protein n=1 Tax=Aeromicrobium sp. TaxID=1871063 RepID=UPI003D6A72FE
MPSDQQRFQLSFLLSRRWIVFALFVVVLAGTCTRLGFWQLERLEHRLDNNQVVKRHLSADPVPLLTVLAPGHNVDETTEWTRVRATGSYDTANEVTVKFTTRDGAPGVDVVTPLLMPDGSAVLVNRGWLQTKNTTARPTNIPPPPSGEVTVMGWLRSDSGADEQAVRPVDGQVRAVSSKGMESVVPNELVGGYLNLRSQEPAAATSLDLEPKPELGQGPHFFYALQWWFFGLLAVIGYFWFARDEMKERGARPKPAA